MTKRESFSRLALRTRLEQHAVDPEIVDGAMTNVLEPFFKIAESSYVLALESPKLRDHCRTAIELAFEAEVKKLVLMPASTFQDDDETMAVCRSLGRSARNSRLGADFLFWKDFLKDVLKEDLEAGLHRMFFIALYSKLREALDKGLGGGLPGKIYDSLHHNHFVALRYFLLAVARADFERMRRVTPLVRVLPSAIVLGENQTEPGTWHVLVGG